MRTPSMSKMTASVICRADWLRQVYSALVSRQGRSTRTTTFSVAPSPQRTNTYASGGLLPRAWRFELRGEASRARAELIWLATRPGRCLRMSSGSFEPVERRQELEGLARGARIVTRLPARRLLRGYRAAEHERAVPGARELVPRARVVLGRELAQDGGRPLVVLVLEPGEALGAPQHGRQLGTLPLPGRRPAPLLRMLGPRLEEKAHDVARDRHLEVAVLLVAALVEGEGDPGVARRIDGAPGVPGDVGEGRVTGDARDVGQKIASDRLELGADPRLDGVHAGLEAVDVEDLEVGRGEAGEGHARVLLRVRRSRIGRVGIEGKDRSPDPFELEAREVGGGQPRGVDL